MNLEDRKRRFAGRIAAVLLAIAGLVGWTLGYLRRTRALWSAAEITGGACIVAGISGWSAEAGLIALGLMLIALSYVRSKRE